MDLRKASFLLIVLPYLGANILSLSESPFFSISNLIILVLVLLAIELTIQWSIGRFKRMNDSEKTEKILSIVLVTLSIEFFYGFTLNIPLHNITQKLFSIDLREKFLLIIALFLLVGLQILFLRKKLSYKAFNIFLLILTIVAFSSAITKKKEQVKPLESIQNNYQAMGPNFQEIHNKVKPVILIIVDEYNSPDNLYQLTKDSSVYRFNQWLNQNHWQTKTNAYSYELSTIHSISSMFNFNLSKDSSYWQQNEEKIVLSKLFHAALADSLENKDVAIYNYGIFDLGKSEYKSRLYLYPRNFVEAFLLYSTYLAEKTKTGSFQTKYLKNPPSYIKDHNKDLLENLASYLEQKQINNKAFVYVHLYMPHNPFSLEPEFNNPETDNFKRYLAYWNFTNKKLETLLGKLTKENKYRIILTGDHGLRGSITNAHASYSAYFGFEGFELDKIQSVQDNGSLINSSF
jgi:hypothetical protein